MFYSYSGQSADVYDEAPPSNSVFRHFLLKMDFPQPAGSGGSQNWTPTDMEDTFAILSYAAEAWGKPLGVMPGVTAFGAAFNLSDNNLNYNRYHYSHSRQFRSNIIAEKLYWNKVLDVCLNNQ